MCGKKQQWREKQAWSLVQWKVKMRRHRKRLLHNSMHRRQVQRGKVGGMNDAPVPAAPPAPRSPRPRRSALRVNVGPQGYTVDQRGEHATYTHPISATYRSAENVMIALRYSFSTRYSGKTSRLARDGRLYLGLYHACVINVGKSNREAGEVLPALDFALPLRLSANVMGFERSRSNLRM